MDLIKQLQAQSDIITNKSAYYKEIEIKPITVGQYFEIAPLLAAIQIEGEVTKDNIHEVVLPQIVKYKGNLEKIFKILFDVKIDKLFPIDLYNLLGIINMQMRHEDFTNVIISISALSRNQTAEIITLQKELKCSTR